MRRFIYTLLVGGIGGMIFLLLAGLVLYRFNITGIGSLVDQWFAQRTVVREIKKEVITVSSDEATAGISKKSRESIWGIKSYYGSRVAGSGSGLAVTEDGLILTRNSVVPTGATYQIFNKDKTAKAKVLWRDPKRSLAILKTDWLIKPLAFGQNKPEIGSTLFIFGQVPALKAGEPFVYRTLVNRLEGEEKIFLEGQPEDYLNGAAVFNTKGELVGLTYIDGTKILALQSSFLRDFVKNYLDRE